MNYFRFFLLSVLLMACACNRNKKNFTQNSSNNIHDTIPFKTFSSSANLVYLPIYSHVYMVTDKRNAYMAATVSIRSISFSDTISIKKVDYYNSKGQLIRKYLTREMILNPMHSTEFVVDEMDTKGGVGAYFLIDWSSDNELAKDPLIQALMLSTVSSMGFSFKTDGVYINRQ